MLDYEEGNDVLADSTVLRRPDGFSLIELMVAITILAILITLALPMAGSWIKNSQIRTAAESLQDGLSKARNEAVRRNAAVEFVLGAGSSWTVLVASDGTVIDSRASGEGSSQVVLTTLPQGATTTTFDGMGRRWGDPATGNNLDLGKTAQMTRICIDLPTAFLPKAQTRNLELDISLSGQVRMCDPEVSIATDARYCPGYPTTCKD